MSKKSFDTPFPAHDDPSGPNRHKRILIAIDDSIPSRWAVKYGGQLAKDLRGRVMLLHVVVPEVTSVDLPQPQETLDAEARARGEKLLEAAGELLPRRVKFDHMLCDGPAADEIVQAAKTWEADMVVMGTRGRGRVAQFLLGSVADAVIRHATCPVLTVGHDPAEQSGSEAPKTYEVA
jgi:nucleotide-binding universal stress UspA family protein